MSVPAKHAVVTTPPKADRKPARSTCHGVELVDDYAWLRAENWQEVMRNPTALAPEIRSYLEAENAYSEAQLADTAALQDLLFKEMRGRLKEDDSSVPAPDGPYAYYSGYVAGGQYPLVYRQNRSGEGEHILIDGNREAEGKAYWDLASFQHSPDHSLIAYASDDKGSELYTVRFRNAATGEDLPDTIPDTRGGVVWANDSKTLFYVRLDDNHRPLKVYRHTLGTPVEDDVLVYAEGDIGFYVAIGETQSGKYIVIDAHDHQTSEVRLIDADNPTSPAVLVAARQHGHEYSVEHRGDNLIITTNSDGAEDFRICEAPVATPGIENWREVIPHRPGCLILDTIVYRDYTVLLERENGLPRIIIRHVDGNEHSIAFPEEAYSLSTSAGYEFDTATVRFVYSSMTTPSEVYDYDMNTRARTLRKRQEVPSGHNAADYVTRRLYAPAPDGETVPVSILYHKNTPLDGSAPVLLYGYGAYGISIPASFSTTRLSLVDRGFIYAIAHIRGGKDKGYRWYTDGKLEKKIHTFTDFIAAGEHLVDQGLTQKGRIVANGGSAGGMLMGVVTNMAPDLFLGIIADVPFVDVLNTMLDASLPLTPPEWPEWGNPIESEKEFGIIHSYSPYENVEAKAYPHIFAYGGLTDPRVTYWEPAKWIARLRERNTSDNLILLKINMDAGHGGASGRYEQLKEIAADYAFALKVAGLLDAPGKQHEKAA
ncbi:S9 family peptidase [Hyphomicrobium sp. D-2]|uniref:S9 family peptidase n=1 Tax=Hyphomicrobium sp. D-2 TaxID=3041621 RepID=UPI00245496CC|nr:S9 family peptidase [Hyphomicrobium sp. D-2]MDH4981279.1 S9 family peptidase [Hyphomicrobium sp. D-2]